MPGMTHSIIFDTMESADRRTAESPSESLSLWSRMAWFRFAKWLYWRRYLFPFSKALRLCGGSTGEESDSAHDSDFEQDGEEDELLTLGVGRSGSRLDTLREMGFDEIGNEVLQKLVARTLFVDEEDWFEASLPLLSWA